ncbi:phage regulatory CII family protein [Paraburkholderia bengalensis]|uniref:Phage regulatory CII family protein n=1 Tax=Paraburkholderia bengalensis TaxID=2747562 RepID=A0ABU8IMI6_9BURK
MNTQQAAHAVAHDFAHNTDTLATLMGLTSGAILRNKVVLNRGPENRNHLTLAEAVRMTEITGDTRIIEAWARELGMTLIKLPEAENCADSDVIELMAKTWETNGDIGREVNATFSDGRVEQHEVRKIKDRVFDHIRTIFGLVGRIEGMAER